MNTEDVLKWGHQTVLRTLDGLPHADWETAGVCGVWSVREIVAHLATFEYLLVDALNTLLDGGPTPYLEIRREHGLAFNDLTVAERKGMSPEAVLTEYSETQAKVMALIGKVPVELRRQNGALPWYGLEYDLEDFIIYSNYAHKREHCAEINVFRDRLAK